MTLTEDYQLELCIDSVESAMGAQAYGAGRVELCAHLDQDGLSPGEELITSVRKAITIDLYVMIRPRAVNFVYSLEEISEMEKEIVRAKVLGADGIVAGVLMTDGRIDLKQTARLIEAARPLPFTFHRAFDVCSEPLESLKHLDKYGVERLLTSGQQDKAIDGVGLISELIGLNRRIQIMAGSGVNADNVEQLWEAGVRQFHFTSHRADAEGINHFDPIKVSSARAVLDRLAQQKRDLPE